MSRVALVLVSALLLIPALPAAQDEKGSEEKPAEAAPAGSWKVILPFVGRDNSSEPRWLIRLQKKDDKWTGEVLASASGWPKATLEKLSVSSGLVRFQLKTSTLSLSCEIKLPKEPAAARLRGTALLSKQPTPIELERTALTSLDKFEQTREKFNQEPLGSEAVKMALGLLNEAEERKVKPAEVRAWAEKAVRSAGLYGTTWQRDVLLTVAQVLSEQKGSEAVALQYAQRAERMLEDKESPQAQKRVLQVLAGALEKAGKAEDAKKIRDRLAKLDFRIKPRTFAGRKAKSDRVVLVELFTNAQSEQAAAADLAYDALGRTFKPSEVVLLQYHMQTRGADPDPLACPDGVARLQFFERDISLPTAVFDGRAIVPGGGERDDAQDKYDQYADLAEKFLGEPAQASLALTATRKGNKIDIAAEVSKLAETGEDVRLRLALVEQEVSYKGKGGLNTFRNVVRSMPGGANGVILKDKTFKKTFTVDLDELRKQLKEYLDKASEKKPFPSKERPLELKDLRVIAYVQNDKTGEVMQAAQAEVKGE